MFQWRLFQSACVLAAHICLILTYEVDLEDSYSYFNEITDGDTPEPTATATPCESTNSAKWDQIFSMLENSQMRENMLLQHADDFVKVEIESLRREMLRFVSQYSGSCGAAVETAGRQIALLLEDSVQETLERLKLKELTSSLENSNRVQTTLEQLAIAVQNQAIRLSKLENSCLGSLGSWTKINSKVGFQLPVGGGGSGYSDQEVTSPTGFEAVVTELQTVKDKLDELLMASRRTYLPAGCEMALSFPMRSRRIYTMVIPDASFSLSSFTVCMWIKPTASFNKTVLFSYGKRQNPYEIQLLLAQTSLLFTVGGEAHLVEAHGVTTPGEWVHLCGDWSSEEGLAKLWANGRKVASTPGVAEGHVIPEGGLLQLGQERNGCCGSSMQGFEEGFDSKLAFAGKMTGVNMWDRVLTDEEISLLAPAGGEGCQVRGSIIAWGMTEMLPHGGAQFIY